jgi:hypothetical protein
VWPDFTAAGGSWRSSTLRRVDLDSVAAVTLGALSLWFGAVWPWWQKREAHPEVRFEEISYPAKQDWRTDHRVVIVNHGPAVMRQVTLRLRDEKDSDYEVGNGLWPQLPIPELHPGQAFHLPLILTFGGPQLRSAVLGWRDRRAGGQQRTFWVTMQRVT